VKPEIGDLPVTSSRSPGNNRSDSVLGVEGSSVPSRGLDRGEHVVLAASCPVNGFDCYVKDARGERVVCLGLHSHTSKGSKRTPAETCIGTWA
jgi:hypothetical protein